MLGIPLSIAPVVVRLRAELTAKLTEEEVAKRINALVSNRLSNQVPYRVNLLQFTAVPSTARVDNKLPGKAMAEKNMACCEGKDKC
jgi:hypothetical protein